MKAKTIKAIIGKKMREWWDSIEDVPLRERVEQATIVTGGSIASMLLKEPVNDFDVYLRDKATCSAMHTARHEKGCTANPNRECGLCRIDGDIVQPAIADLVAAYRADVEAARADHEKYWQEFGKAFYELSDEQTVRLFEVANGCPACMLAGIHQSGITDVRCDIGYKAMVNSWFERIRELQEWRGTAGCGSD